MSERPVTLITGTRKGIGRFLAEHYLERGHLVVGCSRQPAEWQREGYAHHLADVADERAMKRVFSAIRKEHGRLDHLVNNAGIASMNHALLTPMASVERVLATNVAGAFLCCREAAKLMKPATFGRIVNFSTVAVPMRLPGEAVYAASKSAVETLTRILAYEFGPFGITVNALGPNPLPTDLVAGVGEERLEQLVQRQAVRRQGTMEDVANVVDFFLRRESGQVTGQVLYLGGL